MAFIADHSTGETVYLARQTAFLLQEALDELSERERLVVILRATHTARWLSEHLDVSHTMVLKIEKQALEKMRQHFSAKGITSVRHLF